MEAISKSRKKAGESLGKMKARQKTFVARKTQRSTADTGTLGQTNNILRTAVAAVQAENALKKKGGGGAGENAGKLKLRLLVGRLLRVHRCVGLVVWSSRLRFKRSECGRWGT